MRKFGSLRGTMPRMPTPERQMLSVRASAGAAPALRPFESPGGMAGKVQGIAQKVAAPAPTPAPASPATRGRWVHTGEGEYDYRLKPGFVPPAPDYSRKK